MVRPCPSNHSAFYTPNSEIPPRMSSQFSAVESLNGHSLDKVPYSHSNHGARAPNEHSLELEDSEAETERMHESPTKKRMAEELSLQDSKKIKLAGRDLKLSPGGAESDETVDLTPNQKPSQVTRTNRIRNVRTTIADNVNIAESANELSDNESEGEGINDRSEDSGVQSPDTQMDRSKAIEALTDIEIAFSRVRDRLHDQQLARFDLEILMCSEGTHPELQQYNAQISDERDKHLKRIKNLLRYQMDAINAHTRAGRCSAVQTFLKNRVQVRNELLSKVTERWYQTNAERVNVFPSIPDYGYVASGVPHNVRKPTIKSMGVKTHSKLLNMPAAPSVSKVTDSERDEDLRSLGLL